MMPWIICNNQDVIECERGCKILTPNKNNGKKQQMIVNKCSSKRSLHANKKEYVKKSLKIIQQSEQDKQQYCGNIKISNNQLGTKKKLASQRNNDETMKSQCLKFYSPKMSIQSENSSLWNIPSPGLPTRKDNKDKRLSKISINYINRTQNMQSNPQTRISSQIIPSMIKMEKNMNYSPNKPQSAIFKLQQINGQKQYLGLAKSMGFNQKRLNSPTIKKLNNQLSPTITKLNQIQCVKAQSIIGDDQKIDEISIVVSSIHDNNPFDKKNLIQQWRQLSTKQKHSHVFKSKTQSPKLTQQETTSYQ